MTNTLKNILNLIKAYKSDKEHNIGWLEAQIGAELRHYKDDYVMAKKHSHRTLEKCEACESMPDAKKCSCCIHVKHTAIGCAWCCSDRRNRIPPVTEGLDHSRHDLDDNLDQNEPTEGATSNSPAVDTGVKLEGAKIESQDAICTEHGREGCFHRFPVEGFSKETHPTGVNDYACPNRFWEPEYDQLNNSREPFDIKKFIKHVEDEAVKRMRNK